MDSLDNNKFVAATAISKPASRRESQQNGTDDGSNVDSDNDKQPSVLMSLPLEIWSMILEYVPQRDRVRQRLVSKQWCTSVDDWSSFKIVYNQVPESLRQHVFNLRIRACEFSGLKDEFDLEFAHPLFLKDITFGPWVSSENSKKILSQCPNVESLKFFATEKSDTNFHETEILDPISYLKNLKMLRSIEIGVLHFGRRSSSAISPTFAALIGNRKLVFPALSEVTIQYIMTKKEWIELMQFLGRHRNTMRGLSLIQCICEAVNLSEDGGSAEEEPVMANFAASNLTSFVIMKGSTCSCSGDFLWSKLLSVRKGVQRLWTNLVPNTAVISEFVGKHQSTLRTVKLYEVSLGVDATMDACIFQHCNKLEELLLHFLSCSVIVIKVRPEPGGSLSPFTKRYSEFFGLQFLPKSLKSLSITGCDIMSSTIMDMSSALTGLLELHIGDPGSPSRSDYGVTFDILLSLIKNVRGMNSLRIHEDAVNKYSMNIEGMWEKIHHVFQIYGLTEGEGPKAENCLAQTSSWMTDSWDFSKCNPIILNFKTMCGSRSELLERLQLLDL